MEATTMADVLSRAAEAHPDREALVSGIDRVTYGTLERSARSLAGGLRALGVAHGDRVALVGPNGAAWAAALFGIASVAAAVPLNARAREEEMVATCAHARPAALVVCGDGEREASLAEAVSRRVPGLRVVAARELAAAGGDREARSRPGDVAIVQYTSGTTAAPKGVLLGHAQVARNAAELGARLDLRSGDRYGSAMPFHHVGGSVLTLLLAAARGATAVTLPRFEPAAMLALLADERCTHFFGIESHCVMLLERPELTTLDRSSLRVAFVGGRRAVLEGVRARLCATIVNRYGLTESSGNTCSTEPGDDPEVALSSMGRPLPGLEVRVVDGEIRVRGWAVTRGYLDDPAATAAAFDAEGWLRTGDRGEIDRAGRLVFGGRIRDALRVGGENVAAAEIEDLIGRHPAVAQVAVVPRQDPRLGEVPVAFVELRGGRHVTEEEIVAHCRERASGFKVPRRVTFVRAGEWPLTESGKIRKDALRDRVGDGEAVT